MTALLDELKGTGRTGLFIGGEWREGDGSMAVIDPASEETLAEVATASVVEGKEAIDAADAAAGPLAAMAPRARGEILRKAFELMIEREEALAELIVLENGKAYSDALGEVRYGAEFFRWFSEEAARVGGEIRTSPGGDKKIIAISQPVGMSLLITPWNFPAAMATRKIGPAIAAGCTSILKPASDTPLTALAVAAILEEAGLPSGAVNVISARGSSGVIEQMLEDPRIRKISFTGSTQVGRYLLEKSAGQVLRTSMELGGNAPFVVFDDADLDAAIDGAMIAKMRNAGEACTAANRFLVHASIADEFTDRLSAAMGSLRLGPGIDRSTQVGPMINAKSRDEIAALVQEAVDDGASVATGGRSPERTGFFYEPTVLRAVPAGAGILGKEIFGPVAPVVSFDTEEEAIRLANDTEYGLISYIYTQDLSRGMRVSEAIESGMVGLNRGLVSDPGAPFGGVKQSGLGREGGRQGIYEFLETKYIATAW
jgi:succinate-semialdehyde dehydrogenase/glutarate-semialdehyde dehydrogenase